MGKAPASAEKVKKQKLTYTKTSREASEILKVTPHHVRYLYRHKRIKGKKIGRDYLFNIESLDEYNETRQPQGRPKDPPMPKTAAGIERQKRKRRGWYLSAKKRKSGKKQ